MLGVGGKKKNRMLGQKTPGHIREGRDSSFRAKRNPVVLLKLSEEETRGVIQEDA